MANETNKYEIRKEQTAEESGSVTAATQNLLKKGADAYGEGEQVVGEAYPKTTQKVNETYEKAKSYSGENQGKTILIFRPQIQTRRQRPFRNFP